MRGFEAVNYGGGLWVSARRAALSRMGTDMSIPRYRPQSKPESKPAAPLFRTPSKQTAKLLFDMHAEQLVVADELWPAMFRVRLKDGSLSGLYQLGQARDLARVLVRNAFTGAG